MNYFRKANARFLSTVSRNYKYFENPEIKNNIAIIRLNGPDKMNVLNKPMLNEAKILFDNHIFSKNIKGIVFSSSKSDNFIAGADINMLEKAKSKEEIIDITSSGNDFFNKIKNQY